MNVRLRMYQVLLFKFGRHLCKGSIRSGNCTWATGRRVLSPLRHHNHHYHCHGHCDYHYHFHSLLLLYILSSPAFLQLIVLNFNLGKVIPSTNQPFILHTPTLKSGVTPGVRKYSPSPSAGYSGRFVKNRVE